ncbi:MAG: diguanylate cyclase [Clostridia bacterium]|nr:diguanylate cyclase [Clostridia bacterium]
MIHGHKAGDEYIRSASRLICEIFQHSPVYPVGGDEFVVILYERDHANREKLMNNLNRQVENNLGTNQVIISTGIADYQPGSDHSFHPLFERADQLMYQRKQELKAMGAKTR